MSSAKEIVATDVNFDPDGCSSSSGGKIRGSIVSGGSTSSSYGSSGSSVNGWVGERIVTWKARRAVG